LVDIGNAYGEKPLALPGLAHFNDRVPMVRDWYFNPTFEKNNQ
jgi:hypothetical protein